MVNSSLLFQSLFYVLFQSCSTQLKWRFSKCSNCFNPFNVSMKCFKVHGCSYSQWFNGSIKFYSVNDSILGVLRTKSTVPWVSTLTVVLWKVSKWFYTVNGSMSFYSDCCSMKCFKVVLHSQRFHEFLL